MPWIQLLRNFALRMQNKKNYDVAVAKAECSGDKGVCRGKSNQWLYLNSREGLKLSFHTSVEPINFYCFQLLILRHKKASSALLIIVKQYMTQKNVRLPRIKRNSNSIASVMNQNLQKDVFKNIHMTKLISILPPSENHTIGGSKSVRNEVRIAFTLSSKRFAIFMFAEYQY